ncbi:hypothetical protein [Lentibacillus sp. CBA3610]|uniref:hypothetical protein n=1 Tax=Lentibacillus sp. CBA3610 TaxID=2518176 RepID=UPI001595FFC4|nr:hypothetical protein [Lentibacillus sp. CBA3610]QKY68547.1 hypothetical protein Len3610_01985 [Lentibacillus sp. CBA3610]
MPKRIFLLCLTFIFTVSVAVACSSQSNENDAQNNGEESAQSNEDENEMRNQDNEGTEGNSGDTQNDDETGPGDDQSANETNDASEQQSSSSDDNASANSNELPKTIEIGEQIQHEDGVTLTLEQISFEEDHITVDFNAENHSGFSEYLASGGRAKGSNLGGITLQDDTGYDYRYVADDDSDRIKLEDQEKVTGTVSFAGRIQDDAQSLTLIFNPDNVEPQFNFEDIEIEW